MGRPAALRFHRQCVRSGVESEGAPLMSGHKEHLPHWWSDDDVREYCFYFGLFTRALQVDLDDERVVDERTDLAPAPARATFH